MRIGTNPTHTFNIPADVAQATAKARVVYSQGERVVLRKDVSSLSGNSVVVMLTQEDTLKFNWKIPIDIQLRILTNAGVAKTSNIMTDEPYRCLELEVFE